MPERSEAPEKASGGPHASSAGRTSNGHSAGGGWRAGLPRHRLSPVAQRSFFAHLHGFWNSVRSNAFAIAMNPARFGCKKSETPPTTWFATLS